jgi:outer membrane protein
MRSFAVKNYTLLLLVLLVTATLLVTVAGIGSAQTAATPASAAPVKVGVIQIQAALASTKDGQAAAAELETRLGPRRKELEKQQADIKDSQDKLQRNGNTLSQAAKDDLTRNIDRKTTQLNRDTQDAQAELDEETQRLIRELSDKMMPVIDKYAQEHGFSVILDVSNPQTPVIYASNTVDITKDIIELYDKTAPAPAKPATGAAKPPASPAKPPATPAKPPAAAPAKP